MANVYYDTVTKLEQESIDEQYISGWESGFLRNPEREEQTQTDAYATGYADGREGNTAHKDDWKH